jgi:NitT/TauT family transport system substrate-binding protein
MTPSSTSVSVILTTSIAPSAARMPLAWRSARALDANRPKDRSTTAVDAITGFSFSSYFNLVQNKIAPDDISVMLMSDHGIVMYGNAIMVNPDFAKANPKIVAGFVRATIKGFIDTAKDPDAAIKSVMKRNDTGDEKVELARLKMALRDNMVTPWVKANGVGDVDMARLVTSIDQIADTYEFKNRPKAEDIFTSQFLPPADQRNL